MTFSILRHRYSAIVDEMTAALENAAWTSLLGLARDFSCAVFDGDGSLIAMLDGCPLHVTSMAYVVQSMVRDFEGDLADGDVIVSNDPYSGNSHVGDVVFASPVFVGGELAFWSGVKVHHLDIGSPWPTSMPYLATDVWTEGLTITPLKLSDGGRVRQDVFRMLLANLRYPDQIRGDLLAQLGSVGVGRRGLLGLVDRYGMDVLARHTDAMQAYAYQRASAEIASWPDGVYVGESWLDSDGRKHENLLVRATVEIAGDQVRISFDGTALQTGGAANSSAGNTAGAACLPILECLDPDIPKNHGCQLHVTTDPGPPGTLTHALWPAATAIDTALTGDCVQEAVWKALAQAVPDKVMAGVAKAAGVNFCSGVDERDPRNRPWGMAIFNSGGGGGASKGHDGWHQMICYNCMGCLKCSSIEMMELLYPVLFEQLEIEPESGGAGQWVGGPGIRTVMCAHGGSVENFVCGEGMLNPPYGAVGGEPGCGGGQWCEHADSTRSFFGSKAHINLGTGERWVNVSSGGGGYGRPIDRDPERVAVDVRNEAVSATSAAEVYGVVLCGDFAVDAAATARLRESIATSREYVAVKPLVPAAATWLAGEMRPGETFVQDSI